MDSVIGVTFWVSKRPIFRFVRLETHELTVSRGARAATFKPAIRAITVPDCGVDCSESSSPEASRPVAAPGLGTSTRSQSPTQLTGHLQVLRPDRSPGPPFDLYRPVVGSSDAASFPRMPSPAQASTQRRYVRLPRYGGQAPSGARRRMDSAAVPPTAHLQI